MSYFPIEIEEDEIFVRYLTSRDLRKGKLRYNDVFLDTRYPCVSLQRYRFCNEECCRNFSEDLAPIAFLIFNNFNFKKTIAECSDLRGVIVYSPMDENGQYLSNRNHCNHFTVGNPYHSDILYESGEIQQDYFEVPRTSIREFSKKLFRNSLMKAESNISETDNIVSSIVEAEAILKPNL